MIYFGFDEVVYGWSRYFDLCNSFELRSAVDGADNPSIATLNRWRVESPRGFAWLLHVEPEINRLIVEAFEHGDELPKAIDDAISATEVRAHALAAKALVLETPPELPPSDHSRHLLAKLGQRLSKASKRPVLWEASGLWTREDASAVADAAGFHFIVDPFQLEAEGERLPPSPIAAFRVTERAAARRQFDGYEMEQLVDWSSQHERAFLMLAGRYKITHAKELSLFLREDEPAA